MNIFDVLLAPIYLAIIYGLANAFKSKVTNKITAKYYIPALTVKLIGALALGLVYQFYYGNGTRFGGDTQHYYAQSQIVADALIQRPSAGIKLLLSNREYDPDTYDYASRMFWYKSPSEFFVIKVAAVCAVLCFKCYLPMSLLFAAMSFTGMWAMYLTFLKIYPALHKQFATAIFFLPSVFFWGSGLIKDSLTIGALGWVFFGFYNIAIEKKNIFKSFIIPAISVYTLFIVKVYILLTFLPPALFWVFIENNKRIKNTLVRNLAKPLFFMLGIGAAYFGATTLTEGDKKYDIDNIAKRTEINAVYLSEFVESGSAYNIGIFDGSINSMLTVGPQAIVVALFRPFIWEVRNPIMLLSAIEASIFIYLTISLFFKTGVVKSFRLISTTPILLFCFVFSIVFAFAVGTNSGNFGTLVRYKIPLMPFYLCALYIMRYHYLLKTTKKVSQRFVTA